MMIINIIIILIFIITVYTYTHTPTHVFVVEFKWICKVFFQNVRMGHADMVMSLWFCFIHYTSTYSYIFPSESNCVLTIHYWAKNKDVLHSKFIMNERKTKNTNWLHSLCVMLSAFWEFVIRLLIEFVALHVPLFRMHIRYSLSTECQSTFTDFFFFGFKILHQNDIIQFRWHRLRDTRFRDEGLLCFMHLRLESVKHGVVEHFRQWLMRGEFLFKHQEFALSRRGRWYRVL